MDSQPRYILHYAIEALEPQPPIEWIIEGIFSAGSVSLVVGKGGTKKTYSMIDAALCVASGTPWLDKPVSQGVALLIDEESGHRRMLRRVGACMRGHKLDDAALAWVTLAQFNFTTNSDVRELEKLLEFTGARIVIIDALADVALGADENSVKDMQPLFLKLRVIADKYQCAIVVIHHANKLGDYRGSTAIHGALDLMLMVDSKAKSANVEFTGSKTRDVEEFELAGYAEFGKDDDGNDTFRMYASTPMEKQEHFSKSESYVIEYLTDHGNSTMTDIKANADRCSANAARQAVYNLVQRGKVCRVDNGGLGDSATYGLVNPDSFVL